MDKMIGVRIWNTGGIREARHQVMDYYEMVVHFMKETRADFMRVSFMLEEEILEEAQRLHILV